jgi:DivIVA domain-containing protein
VSGHIFISYSRRDRAYVEKLAAHLRGAGTPVWYDFQIVTGDRFAHVIQQNIELCAAFVVVLTGASATSEWVGREITYALKKRKPIFPLLLEECPDKIELINLHHENVIGGVLPDSALIDRLVSLAGANAQPAPPPVQAEPRDVRAEAALVADYVRTVTFRKPAVDRRGYDEYEVDTFLDLIVAQLVEARPGPNGLTPADVRNVAFKKPPEGMPGYDEEEVDDFLDRIEADFLRLFPDRGR